MPITKSTLHEVRKKALTFLAESFEAFYEYAIAVDQQGVISWISDGYMDFLGLEMSPVGHHITDIIPNSYLPHVVTSGKPVFLDLLYIRSQWVVVSAIPLQDERGNIVGGFAFVAIESASHMKPLLAKYNVLQSQIRDVSRQVPTRNVRYQLSQIAGRSEALRTIKHQIRQAARYDISVLLTGETGTGKELFAHALHDLSERSGKPFISINVAAIPESLIEAEFFGVAPGAYTGAQKEGRPGKFEIAEGGTLFLDEIGDMPLVLQAKLLRALQEREFERIGSNKVQKADVRIVAATSRDLGEMVDEGEFRADLYYRLNGMPIHLPPLRERISDIEMLSERILDECAGRLGLLPKELTSGALDLLCHHDWPGNVRELYNVLERACILSENDNLIDITKIQDLLGPRLSKPRPPVEKVPEKPVMPTPSQPPRPLKTQLQEAEAAAIDEALCHTRGNRSEAARLLGISRAALYEKLKHGRYQKGADADN
ncbi:sigma-54 interaction domain-containing protein [Nitrincola alkalilacustris]|uniref:sigma-54 interaction domain-containing protein n=1 Tax=Nitrincola alkalilacustris TaxID=1571224 RepID=UPI00124F2757|nr:sigma 54-interacting transcriptional regulator [Nitrincola alkalilacustris]